MELPDHQKGLIVLSLEPDGPAARAGILIGDIVTSVADTAVGDTDDVQLALEKHGAGSQRRTGIAARRRGADPARVVGERRRG